jgi:hypothetical protein
MSPANQSYLQSGAIIQNKLTEAILKNKMHPESMVQINDHEKDTDDVLEENTYVQDHDNDTDDLSELVDPINQSLLFIKIQE